MIDTNLQNVVEALPATDELRSRLAENIRERKLLNRLIKLAQDRDQLHAVRNVEGRNDD